MFSVIKNIADGNGANGQVTSKIENLPKRISIKRFIIEKVDPQGAIQQQQSNANSFKLKLNLPIIKTEGSGSKSLPNVKIIGQIDKINEIPERPDQNPTVVNDNEKEDSDSEVNTDEETFVCSICDCSFTKKHELFRHFRKFHHHHQSNHICLSCRQEFDSITDLDEHKKVHIEEFENQPYDDVVTNSLNQDDEEKKTEETDKTPESVEKEHVVRNSNLRKHRIKSAHRILRDNSFSSDNVGLTQIFLPSLMNGIPDHVLATGSIKIHQALKKGEELPIPNNDLSNALQRYQPVHNNARFPCTVCSAKFQSKEELCQHLSGHYKEIPYQCGTCGLRLKCQNQFLSHMAVHKSKFKCDHCDKTFVRRVNLEQHIQTHTKPLQMQFKCQFCSKEFKHKCTFKRHLKGHKRAEGPEFLSSSSSESSSS